MLSFNLLGRYGRLGNQMFQYAALIGISKRRDTDFCIPPSNAWNLWQDHQLFQVFKLPSVKKVGYQKTVVQIQERSFTYDKELHTTCPKDADIRGYFQSEKYFNDVQSIIKAEFEFKTKIREYSARIRSQFKRQTISLHVRRGDYLKSPESHPVCSMDYYESALANFPTDLPVLIFSDDIDWCKQEKLFQQRRFVFFGGHANYIDMCLMAMCDHHIIANSSFSWWGAWLGANVQKCIVAPKIWFGQDGNNGKLETCDLIPENWLKL